MSLPLRQQLVHPIAIEGSVSQACRSAPLSLADAYLSAAPPFRSDFGPVTQITVSKSQSTYGLLKVKPSIRNHAPEVYDHCLEGLAR